MKIVVDQNIRAAEATFGRHADLVFIDGRQIRKDHLIGARALIIRTATRVDSRLLAGTGIGFVGTTSIGTDHLDIDYLQSEGIAWANAPGCNADSAAQYTLAMIWLACERLGRRLRDQSAGIIGRGNVGSRVQTLLHALGVETVANDPPLADMGERELVSLDEALDRDIVCLHVPLSRDGPWPTFRMIGSGQLSRMPEGALLVNTARGDVIDGGALLGELRTGRLQAALDVWPGEPVFRGELLRAVTVATPHVAGYSNDGKWNGTTIVYQAFCRWAGEDPIPFEAPASGYELRTDSAPGIAVSQALDAACFVSRHDGELRALSALTPEQRAVAFDLLRKDYPSRRDFHAWTIDCPDVKTALLLENIGFSKIA